MENGSCTSENKTDVDPPEYRHALLLIYIIVLIGGITSVSLMINTLKSNVHSVTTTAVLNLIVVHLLFLLTVPFRIYYYATSNWPFGLTFCKVVSAMIHAHMYLAFVFYVIILVYRYQSFFKVRQVDFYRRFHALYASVAVWALVLTVVVPIVAFNYGDCTNNNTNCNNQCFRFGWVFDNNISAAVLNYILSAVIIILTLALAACQVWILGRVYRVHRETVFAQQEFLAQVKSIFFMLVIIICFIPYNTFRIYYVSNYNAGLQVTNDIALAVTTLSCFDMLVFIGREAFRPCDSIFCRL